MLTATIVLFHPGYAASTSNVAGNGTSVLTCPGGVTVPSATISFSTTTTKGTTTGAGGILFPAVVQISFKLNSGHFNAGSYAVEGFYGPPGPTGFCSGFIGAATVTITGLCGTGVSIFYSDSNGISATFIGKVGCT